jgi:arginine utilization protein RocB
MLKTPKITVYIDGPFYPETDLRVRDAQKKLRDQIYETMKKRSENSTYERIKYVKKEG